jgi:hypothetical protein
MRSTVKTFLFVISICHPAYAQDIKLTSISPETESTPVTQMRSVDKFSIIKSEESFKYAALEKAVYDFQFSVKSNRPKNIIPQLDIISSFRSNIRFGGFWDKYTIINFTPQMYIKPVDFISIYAIHQTSFFVPIDGIKPNIRSMALRSAAVILVDNSVKIFLGSSKVIGPVLGFLAKNLLIYTVNKMEKEADKKNNLISYDHHYYSISIRF